MFLKGVSNVWGLHVMLYDIVYVVLTVAFEQGPSGSSSKLFHKQRYAVQVQRMWRGKIQGIFFLGGGGGRAELIL